MSDVVYCINFYGILFKIEEKSGIISKIMFVDHCTFRNNAKLNLSIKKYWKGNTNALEYQVPVFYSKFIPIFEEVQKIPCGKVSSYGGISSAVFGDKRYARFVGAAMRNNPLPIIIPCHRVVRSNGEIGGFSGGIDNKIKMLKLEKVGLHNGFIEKEYFINC
ncbi:MAG: methylated-DNA--[protein]-cysteine S-methyltransferase [Caldisericota bacterium]|nr:methylated-DNA--[protein]-cysteine S-methyltransferase [Caldisericota bacterium]